MASRLTTVTLSGIHGLKHIIRPSIALGYFPEEYILVLDRGSSDGKHELP